MKRTDEGFLAVVYNRAMGKMQDFNDIFEQLPETYQQEVLDFMEFLVRRAQKNEDQIQLEQTSGGEDPLQAFIGAVEHGSLAQGIDETLYG